jgi:hypothetical protein
MEQHFRKQRCFHAIGRSGGIEFAVHPNNSHTVAALPSLSKRILGEKVAQRRLSVLTIVMY